MSDNVDKEMDYWDWLDFGLAKGWIAEPTCYSHDAIPCTEEEDAEMSEYGDPCIPVIRVWEDKLRG